MNPSGYARTGLVDLAKASLLYPSSWVCDLASVPASSLPQSFHVGFGDLPAAYCRPYFNPADSHDRHGTLCRIISGSYIIRATPSHAK